MYAVMIKKMLLMLVILVAGAVLAVFGAGVQRSMAQDWRTASRESIGIAPDPAVTLEAVAQVYAARAVSWRGVLGVHTWIAVKPTGAPAFTIYEVLGWRAMRGMSAVVTSNRAPDGRWFGAAPELLADIRGEGVDAMIEEIDRAARAYPYPNQYRVWPGPNSNTFTAFVARQVPALKVDLPPTAIGKDYLPNGDIVAQPPGGKGVQVSLFGLLGFLVGPEEGLEINILGLTFGVDPMDLALKLPGVGRLGWPSGG
jgi:hypothetical protein